MVCMSSSKYFIFSLFSSLKRSGNKSSNSSKNVPLLSRNSSERDGGSAAGNISWRLNSGRGSAISCKKLFGHTGKMSRSLAHKNKNDLTSFHKYSAGFCKVFIKVPHIKRHQHFISFNCSVHPNKFCPLTESFGCRGEVFINHLSLKALFQGFKIVVLHHWRTSTNFNGFALRGESTGMDNLLKCHHSHIVGF